MESNTSNPDLAYLNIAPDSTSQEKYTSFTSIVSDFADQLSSAYDYHLANLKSDSITAEAQVFSDLNSKLGDYGGEFILFWINKYQTAHEAVKIELDKILGDNNVFFKDFSESIGSLKYIEFLKERSTLSIIDTDSAILDIPAQYNAAMYRLMDVNTKTTTLVLSKLTNAVFKQNIVQLGEPQKQEFDGTTTDIQTVGFSDQTHGVNLSVDYEHYKRMKGVAADITELIQTDLQGLFKAISFIDMHIEEQDVKNQTIVKNIEDAQVKVDFLGKKIVSGVSKESTSTVMDYDGTAS